MDGAEGSMCTWLAASSNCIFYGFQLENVDHGLRNKGVEIILNKLGSQQATETDASNIDGLLSDGDAKAMYESLCSSMCEHQLRFLQETLNNHMPPRYGPTNTDSQCEKTIGQHESTNSLE